MHLSIDEKTAALICVFIGVLVAAVIAPDDSSFFANFMFFWLPQAGIFVLLVIVYPRFAVISGAALILAFYLAAFDSWNSLNGPESMAWLGYLFSLPGAAIGAVAGAVNIKNKTAYRAPHISTAIAAYTLTGLLINQTLVCSTMMHCGFNSAS
jgi:hypothetical protein